MLDFGDVRERGPFHMLVRTVILKAAYVAATRLGGHPPRRFAIAVVGSACDGRYADIADATDALFRDDGLCARTIDVAVGNIRGDFADVRIVVVDPGPCLFAESLNQPKGYGPFRVVHWDVMHGSAR
jgi:hypothetical protein